MNSIRRIVAALTAAAALALPSAAFADPAAPQQVVHGQGYTQTVTKDSEHVTFIDDPIGADGAAPTGAAIVVRHSAGTAGLVTPRTSFVHEMLKSVEQI